MGVQNFITIPLPFADDTEWCQLREADVTALVEALGNPARDEVRAALGRDDLVHFMSINVVGADVGSARPHLLIEATVDGPTEAAIRSIAEAMGDWLFPIVKLACGLRSRPELLSLLLRHSKVLTSNPLRLTGRATGLPFLGLPGVTVAEVRDNQRIVEAARHYVERCRKDWPWLGPQTTFQQVHRLLAENSETRALLGKPQPRLYFTERADAPWLELERRPRHPILNFIGRSLQWLMFIVLIPYLLVFLFAAYVEQPHSLPQLLYTALGALFPAIFLVGGLAGILILALRRDERANTPIDGTPDPALIARMMIRENCPSAYQNHMISVTTIRRGWIRKLALMLAMRAISVAPKLGLMRTGFLATIGTIHSARWVVLPRTRQLVFVSNYDSSWESYLEDFVTKSSTGVTGIWSNTEGFPTSRFLFWRGAEDGDRMKRFARRSMQPTAFWYSAYPKRTCEQLRKQAIIVSGLRCRSQLEASPSDAEAWLDLFSTIPRPDYGLEYEEIQTLLFGGLGSYDRSRCLALSFGEPQGTDSSNRHPYRHVQEWLVDLVNREVVSFGDKLPKPFVCNIAFSAAGLRKLGLDRELATDPEALPSDVPTQGFPGVFALGMAHPSRKQLLADPDNLDWCDDTIDAVLLLYATDAKEAAKFDEEHLFAQRNGLEVKRSIDTALEKFHAGEYDAKWKRRFRPGSVLRSGPPGRTIEPFGFVDGISQPLVRGFPGRQGAADPLHGVEPGEFILGYRDNRGHFPPSPQVARSMAAMDMYPEEILPSVPSDQPTRFPAFENRSRDRSARDFGRNGSYLVIRQLAQDVSGFDAQLDEQTERVMSSREPLNPHPDCPYKTREWLAAKMVGRWRDGSSIVDHPFQPALGDWSLKAEANAFLYRDADPQGMRCPFGAHVRRAFPRDSFAPTDPFELSVTNRHRLLRRGRPYVENGRPAGLLFMCFNADLERQFEFVQQSWLGSYGFHGLEGEVDAFALHEGPRGEKSTCLSIPGPSAPLVLNTLQRYVKLVAGGYFFLPGRHALWFLAGKPWYSDKGSHRLLPP